MEMMRVFVQNMKKYRQIKGLSQMKLAEMLGTSTSYIGEIEICAKIPSLGMVERIAAALEVEPFRLFVEDGDRVGEGRPRARGYLDCLSELERQDLARRIIAGVSGKVERILRGEGWEKGV